jgi:uncharacterized protein (DUF433 family)
MTSNFDWSRCDVVEQNPDRVSGAWVFRGTRVPVSAVLDNLKDLSVAEVAREFPSIDKEQILAVLDFVARTAEVAARR